MATQISSISQALAGNPSSLAIPKPPSVDDAVGQEAATAAGAPRAKGDAPNTGLPTPPNSISPNLPPHAFRAKLAKDTAASPPIHVDSDIDLQEAVDHANSHGLGITEAAAMASDGVNGITPDYLAKYHLADIVLDKGPIAIRHVMNHLGQTVPNFAEIPPAKARRLVVAALESRQGGGLKGNVEFEKVGWGRWDARVKGQPPKENRSIYAIQERGNSSQTASFPPSAPSAALRIPGNAPNRQTARRMSHGSWTAESTMSSRSEHAERPDVDMAEHEADRMSIDDDDEHTARSFDARRRQPSAQPEFYSDTDEEDWSSIGAAALRQNSYSSSGRGKHFTTSLRHGRRSTSFSPFPRSLPGQFKGQNHNRRKTDVTMDFSGVGVDPQEREAIEALMRMGSM